MLNPLSDEARVAEFAERVARRDAPPPPDPHRFAPDRVLDRLVRALRVLLRQPRRARTPARMCYAFLAAPELGTPDLVAAAGIGPVAGGRAIRRLCRLGLFTHRYVEGRKRYRLTRFGEDWLLAVVQDTEIPGPGVGE